MATSDDIRSRFALRPRAMPFYYGWVILAVGTLGVIMSIPGQTMGVSVFMDSLMTALGIGRTPLSLAYMLGTLTSSFLLPTAGRALDRWGARRMVVLATSGLSVSLAVLLLGPAILTLFDDWFRGHLAARVVWSAVRTLPAFALGMIAFIGIRHFGQGQMTMVARTMIGRWFDSRRGLAFAISGVFVAFGFGVAPFALASLIAWLGWREAILVLIAGEMVMLIVGAVFYRDSVEACGLEMEAGMPPREIVSSRPRRPDRTAAEAKRSLVFWLFCLGLTLYGAVITGIVFHFSAICGAEGIEPTRAYKLFLPIAVVSVLSEMIGSYTSDRISIRYHLLVMLAGLAAGTTAVIFIGHPLGRVIFTGGIGISGGLFAALNGVAWPKLFGRQHLGSISGAVTGWLTFGSAFCPLLYSLGLEQFGSFDAVLMLSAVPAILLFVLAAAIPFEG